jgi:hypothetical protein
MDLAKAEETDEACGVFIKYQRVLSSSHPVLADDEPILVDFGSRSHRLRLA